MADIVVYGLHAVLHLLQESPKRAIALSIVDSKKNEKKAAIVVLAKKHGISIKQTTVKELDQELGDDCVHQGIALTCRALPTYREADLNQLLLKKREAGQAACVLILDGVQDPRNLGACLRSAAAFSVDAVVLPKDRSASLTATAEKVACGGAALVPLITVTNVVRTLKALQEERFWVVGLAGEAEQTLAQIDLRGDMVLVMGSEGQGIRQSTEKQCDFLAKIPMGGGVSSLNVSAATAVALYELTRQRS